MLDIVKEKFTGHPKFHPQMVTFILDTMVPRVELEGVFLRPVQILALWMWLSENSRHQWTLLTLAFVLWKIPPDYRWGEEWHCRETPEETRAGVTALIEGIVTMGSSISLETVRVRRKVENLSLDMTLNNISPPPLTQKFRVGFGSKIMDRNNEASQDTVCP